MLTILSHTVSKRKDPLKRGHERYCFDLQIELPEGDTAFVEGGTELIVLFDKSNNEISSYAFVPKNNPARPTISVSLRDDEIEMVAKYCGLALMKQV